jgi:cytidine deaminase
MSSMIQSAKDVLPLSYVPHSGRQEAAAVLTRDGKTFVGSAIDNGISGQGVSALEVAISKAVSEGHLDVRAAVNVDASGRVMPPSARERELLWEFGRGVLVLMEIHKGDVEAWSLPRLLPLADGLPGEERR